MADQKKDPPRPDSTRKLEQALSSISTSEMKAVRAEVEAEISRVGDTPVSPIAPFPARSLSPAPGSAGAPPDRSTLRTSDIEDLQKAGKIAGDFMTGMDRITDVLMLLVLRFGRASTLMRGVFIGNMLGVVLLAANIAFLWNVSASQTKLQQEQEKIQSQQALILERQRDTQLVAGEAKRTAEDAAQKVNEVQQRAPEVVIDSKGKPQLILKVQGGEAQTKTVVPPPKSKIREEGSGQTLEVPL